MFGGGFDVDILHLSVASIMHACEIVTGVMMIVDKRQLFVDSGLLIASIMKEMAFPLP